MQKGLAVLFFALVGPRQISETVSTFQGLSVKLTPEEIAWLNLE